MNFKLPQQDDDFDYYANSSQDESRGSQGTHCFKPFSIHLKIKRTHISFMLKLNIFLHIVLFSSNLLEVCIINVLVVSMMIENLGYQAVNLCADTLCS